VFEGLAVPPVLLSGDHAAIRRWRLKQALGRTAERRADLLARVALDAEREALLAEYMNERTGR
jgi:tRNA (guanine37-N1)-methyltransferase